MEAKETVMITEGCNKFRDGSCVRNCCNTRADKAFKAGIREVVELLKLYNPVIGSDEGTNCYMLDIPVWQFKLKEWGIEDAK